MKKSTPWSSTAEEQEAGSRCFSLPREKLRGGTSEILNWVALAGAMEKRELKYFEYVTTYRSPAATGCGMGFAYWT